VTADKFGLKIFRAPGVVLEAEVAPSVGAEAVPLVEVAVAGHQVLVVEEAVAAGHPAEAEAVVDTREEDKHF
jgi:hypothetical protein